MLVCVEQDVRKNCCYCVNLPPSRLPLSRSPLHSPLWQANSRGLAKHFHAAQLSAQQMRDGFCTRGTDWAQVRSACTKMAAASAAADGGPSGLRGVTSAMRRLRNRGGAAAGGALHRRPYGATSSASASGPLARQPRSSASSSLRALLCRCYLRAARAAAAAAAGGEEDDSDTTSDEDDDDGGGGTMSGSEADQESFEGDSGSGGPASKASSERVRGSGGATPRSGNHLADETGQPLPSGAIAAITPSRLPDEVSEASASDAATAASAIDPAPPRGLPRSCWSCGAEGCGLKKCSRCRRASYCSAACQSAHWREHRAECGVWVGERQRRREAAAADRASSPERGSLTRLAAVD